MNRPSQFRQIAPLGLIAGCALLLSPVAAQEEPKPAPPSTASQKAADGQAKPVPLNQKQTILLDRANRKLIVNAKVVLRQGMLEMLLCKKQTKEHESILAFDGQAKIIHAGLLALGLEPGEPVVFIPEFQAPSGPKLKIELVWTDNAGKQHRVDAHEWIRHSIHRYFAAPLEELPAEVNLPRDDNLRYDATNNELSWYGPMTKKQQDHYLALSDDSAYQKAIKSFHTRTRSRPLKADFVFTGSELRVDERTGEKIYLAESGDVICVANFPSALIDVATRSSAEGQQNLLFEAWTERIPPQGTPVRVEISPAKKEKAKDKENK